MWNDQVCNEEFKTEYIVLSGACSHGWRRIGNQVQILNGPATVTGINFLYVHPDIMQRKYPGKEKIGKNDPEVRRPAR